MIIIFPFISVNLDSLFADCRSITTQEFWIGSILSNLTHESSSKSWMKHDFLFLPWTSLCKKLFTIIKFIILCYPHATVRTPYAKSCRKMERQLEETNLKDTAPILWLLGLRNKLYWNHKAFRFRCQ